MAYNMRSGDEIEITYKNEDGEIKETHGTVEVNYANIESGIGAGMDKVKLKRGSGRTAHKILLFADGTIRCQPYYNSNGSGEDGRLVEMSQIA